MEALIDQTIEAQTLRKNNQVNAFQADALAAVRRFVTKHGLMLHGGIALHAVLPEDTPLYDDTNVPDYDVLYPGEPKKARRLLFPLVEQLKAAGFKSFFNDALHANTIKLRGHPAAMTKADVVGVPELLDITCIPAEDVKRLSELAAPEKHLIRASMRQFDVVPTAYMKYSMHFELCKPLGYIERWKKVYPRLNMLYARAPGLETKPRSQRQQQQQQQQGGGGCGCSESGVFKQRGGASLRSTASPLPASTPQPVLALAQALGRVAMERHWVEVGGLAHWRITGRRATATGDAAASAARTEPLIEYMAAASDTAETIRAAVQQACGSGECAYAGLREGTTTLNRHHVVSLGDAVVAIVYEPSECLSYNVDVDGALVGSTDLVLYYLYGRYITYPEHRGSVLTARIDALVRLQSEQTPEDAAADSVRRRFVLQCLAPLPEKAPPGSAAAGSRARDGAARSRSRRQ